MRISLLLAPVALAFFGNGTLAQTPPSQTPDLPTVIKPKTSAKPRLSVEPQPDSSAVPDPAAPESVEGQDPVTGNRSGIAGRNDQKQAADSTAAPDTNAGPDYTGPSILSRGVNFTRTSLPTNERFRPFVGANFYHDSGVTGKYQGPTSPVTQQVFTGADFNFGISGQHTRRYDAFELDYRGHVYVNGYSGQDHALTAGYTRLLTRRLTAAISESAGLYSNNYAVLNSVAGTDTSVANTVLVVTPNTEAFDDRTYYSSSQADVSYQKSSRLSLNVGVSGFLVKRETRNLISVNGYQARTDVAYRLSKRSTVGPYYAYSRYYYSGTFGDSDIHTVGLNYSFAVTKRTQFRFRVGESRLETRGLQLVVLSPLAAQLLGVTTGTQRYYSVSYSPDVAVDVTRSLRHGEVVVSYLKGVSPGNGVILTSHRDSASATYTYSGIRRYAITFGAGRDALGSVAQQIGSYHSYYGRVSVSRALPHDVQALVNFDYRNLDFTNNLYARNQYRISIGFAFAPGAGPLKFW